MSDVTNRLMRGQRRGEDGAASRASPKFSDGTGLEPAVAEMSRPVAARAAVSFPIRPKLVSASQNPGRGPSPSEQGREDIEQHRHSVISIQLKADDTNHRMAGSAAHALKTPHSVTDVDRSPRAYRKPADVWGAGGHLKPMSQCAVPDPRWSKLPRTRLKFR